MGMQMEPIAWVETCYDEKFGVPRQPGMIREAWGKVTFTEGYRDPSYLRGIEGFSHLWLIFSFHKAEWRRGRSTVRPPRLGGNERRGVFATRSPFRPNGMGLSVVELAGVEWHDEFGPQLLLRGVDLVNGTPLLDIKPYIPFCDSVADAKGGFVDGPPPMMAVKWACEPPAEDETRILIEKTIALDPRPAYLAEGSQEIHGCRLAGLNVRWRVDAGCAQIVSCCGE